MLIFMRSMIFPILTYMHALIEIFHMIYALILDNLAFDKQSVHKLETYNPTKLLEGK